MKVLIIGKNGQVAWELQRTAPAGIEWLALGSDACDIASAVSVTEALRTYRPDAVINCAAYTAVDKAEAEPERAQAINGAGAGHLAAACRDLGARLLHISTDFIFDGTQTRPYVPEDAAAPLSVYGASKWAGEQAIREQLGDAALVVRTAWVYSSHGNNFVKTMLRLMRERPQLGVIVDQVGTPTWARGLAEWLWALVARPEVSGTFHWSDTGVASWYDFAVAIQDLALEKGLLSSAVPIQAIPATAYPTPARRPAYSVLDKTAALAVSGLPALHWRRQLSQMMNELD